MIPRPKRLFAAAFILIIVLSGPVVTAADSTGTDSALDEVLSGFDDFGDMFDSTGEPQTEDVSADSPWDVGGELGFSEIINVNHDAPAPGTTDHRGLSSFRLKLTLEVERDIYESWRALVRGQAFYDAAYSINGRNEYTDDVLDDYEQEAEIQEAWIQGPLLPSLDLKVGRQIVVWGRSENFRVTDILNPLDSRTPGVVDIEDHRLPVCMTKLDYYAGDFAFSAIAIPEIRFSKLPVLGNDFYPVSTPQPREDVPSASLDNTQWAAAIEGTFHGWDALLYGADYFSDQSYYKPLGYYQYTLVDVIELPDGGTQPVYSQIPAMIRRHARLYMVGGAVNITSGDYLLKSELALTGGHKFTNTHDEKRIWKGLVGFEHTGFTNTLISLDLMLTHIDDFDPLMMLAPDYAEEDQFEAALRISKDLMYERLELMFLAIVRGGEAEDGAFERLSAAYDVTDAFTTTVGCVFYQDGGNPTYENIHKNNRVYIDLTYTF